MFIRAHEAGYMCVATLSEKEPLVLTSGSCPYSCLDAWETKHEAKDKLLTEGNDYHQVFTKFDHHDDGSILYHIVAQRS